MGQAARCHPCDFVTFKDELRSEGIAARTAQILTTMPGSDFAVKYCNTRLSSTFLSWHLIINLFNCIVKKLTVSLGVQVHVPTATKFRGRGALINIRTKCSIVLARRANSFVSQKSERFSDQRYDSSANHACYFTADQVGWVLSRD